MFSKLNELLNCVKGKMTDRIKLTYLNINNDPTTNGTIVATMGMCIISMDFYMAKIKLIRRKDGQMYLAPPSEKYTNQKTGKEDYSNYYWFGQKTSEFFQEQGFLAIKTYCEGKHLADPTNGQKPAAKNYSQTTFDC